MDLVSVIVPVYNVQKYLTMCLESISKQTYHNLQIILIDDGSSDASSQICDDWANKDNRIEVIHKINGGLSDARNVGLTCVKGQFICFVDSDDVLDSHYIEWLYDSIKTNKAKVAACDVCCFYDGDSISECKQKPEYTVFSAEEALQQILQGEGVRAIACNKLYSADILEGESFIYGKYHEDEFFTYRIVDRAEKIIYIDAQLYYYRQRLGSITSSFSIKRLDALEAILDRMKLLQDKYPVLYKPDKVNFCILCVSYYRATLRNKNSDTQAIRRKIKKLRKQINFTIAEMFPYSIREKIYIVGSRWCLTAFSKMLNMFRGADNE